MSTETENPPPVSRYKLTVEVVGNTHEEIERELMYLKNGGYLIDSDYYKRDEFRVIGGRTTARLEHTNPGMTPERYRAELEEWASASKAARREATS